MCSSDLAAWLAALCSSRVLGATWFVAYSAVLPLTQVAWGLSAKEAGLIQSGFHLGYLVSLFVVGFLADHFGAPWAVAISMAEGLILLALCVKFWPALWRGE